MERFTKRGWGLILPGFVGTGGAAPTAIIPSGARRHVIRAEDSRGAARDQWHWARKAQGSKAFAHYMISAV